jgi:YhcH/YjgK/YiaL family protein
MVIGSYKDIIIPGEFMNKNWEKALAWLKGESWKNLPPGKFEIDGSRIYATRSSYETRVPETAKYETHRKYADIQMLIEGCEMAQVCDREALEVSEPYSPEKDIDFRTGTPPEFTWIILRSPLAAVYFPLDAHKPNLSVNGQVSRVDKLLIKVALNA